MIRTDLHLTYVQIGVLLSVPAIAGHLVEPALGILGDVWDRRALLLGGGVVLAASMVLIAASPTFVFLLAALAILSPATGAFVALSQASFMDTDPQRHEQNMVRWALAGSAGVLLGALVVGLSISLGGGWRGIFLVSAAATTLVLFSARRIPLTGASGGRQHQSFWINVKSGVAAAMKAVRSRSVLRWLVLLELSDLMLDGLHGYLALYFVDVAETSAAQAAVGVVIWTGFGLLGGLMLIPLLERIRGLTYLRVSAVANLSFSRVPGSGVRGRGSGERETTASSLAGKEESSRKEDNSGQGKDGPAGAIAQGGNGR